MAIAIGVFEYKIMTL